MRTRRKNIFRGIKKNLNRFFSILFIVALGSGFMAGLAATSPDMYATADAYMDQYSWYDLDIRSTLGFTDEDVEALTELDTVGALKPSRNFDMVLIKSDSTTYTSRVYGLESTKTFINGFELTEGRMPENPGECVVESVTGKYGGDAPEVGEILNLSVEDTGYDNLCEIMTEKSLKIVGIAKSPLCISIEGEPTDKGTGTITLHVYALDELFDTDYYTDVYVLVKGAKETDTFSEKYDEMISAASEQIENVGRQQIKKRYDQLKADATEQVDELEGVVSSMENMIEKEKELYASAAVGAQQAAYSTEIIKKLNQNIISENRMYPTYLVKDFAYTVQNVAATLEALEKEQGSLDAQYSKIDELKSQISDAREKINDMNEGSWLIRSRDDSAGYAGYSDNVGKVAALSKIFPVFFFMVALLVALTTMTRLVEENRTQIGTLKALGFKDSQILGEYMLFSMSASILGCAVGFGVGFRLFPTAISSAYGMMYFIPKIQTPFITSIALWVAPITVGSIFLATYFACKKEYSSVPAALLVPEAPPAGKRIVLEHIGFIWNRMSFIHKVTARNLFRYKKRFYMTIIGVAGCTALLVTGFGIKDSINDIVGKQFGEIYKYEMTIVLRDTEAYTEDETLNAFLNDKSQVDAYLLTGQFTGKIISGKNSKAATLFIPEDSEKLPELLCLRDRKTHEEYLLDDTGVIITEKVSEELGVKVGDNVTLEDQDGARAEYTVRHISENYIGAYAFLSKKAYIDGFKKEYEPLTVICLLNDSSNSQATTNAMKAEGVIYARSTESLRDTFDESLKSIDGVIWVLILASGLLCMIVLYNLINVNICERRKELATLRVLGFYEKETKQYVFRETNILSFIGALVGMLLGIWLHSFVIRTVEVNQVMFGRNIYPLSFIYALLITLLFTFIVNRLMSGRIKKVDMVEAMKAND